MPRHPAFLLVNLLAVGAFALGCGAQQAAVSPAANNASGPRYGGVLSIPQASDPWDWDLSYDGKTSPNGYSQSAAYNSLLGAKTGPDVKYEQQILQGELAERWEVSSDARTYTFHLRKGVKFADLPPVNGRELTAADVVWSFEYWSRSGQFKDKKLPPSFLANRFEGLESIGAPNASTVIVRFKDPFVPFLTYVSSNWTPVVAHEIYDLDGHLKDRIVGTGPFWVDRATSQKGSRWIWQKNPTYWDAGKPYLDGMRWLIIADQSTTIAAFVAKQLDFIPITDFPSAEQIRKSAPEAVFYEYTAAVGGCAYLNQESPPLNSLEVRKALSLAIDRDEISQTYNGKKQTVTPPGAHSGLFTDAEARELSRYDPAEAKRLLAQAGFANGVDVEFQFSSESPNVEQQLIQAQVKKVGINMTLKAQDKVTYTDNRKVGKYQIQYVQANCGNLTDEQDSISQIYHSKSALNLSRVNDPELDKLLVAQRQETNPDKRRELQRQGIKRIADMAYSYSEVYPPRWHIWHPVLKGHAPNAQIAMPGFDGSWLER